MKQMTLTKVLAALMCVLGATVALDKPSAAESARQDEAFFSCDLNGIPTTMFNSPKGKTPLIRWRSPAFAPSGWTPEERCKEVSKRFQLFHKYGYLKYLNTGKVGNEYVLCASPNVGVECDKYNVLFTILPDERKDPDAVLRKLLEGRKLGSPLNQSQNVITHDSDGDLYLDVEELLYYTPVE